MHKELGKLCDETQTPDINKLRYNGGPIKVFLWDDLRHPDFLEDYVSDTPSTVSKDAVSVNLFLPWFCISKDPRGGEYVAYMIPCTTDIQLLELEEHAQGKFMPIRGTTYNLTLEQLTELDYYYDNMYSFTRKKIQVRAKTGVSVVNEAYTYMNTLHSIGKYNPHTKKYKPRVDLALMNETPSGQQYIF